MRNSNLPARAAALCLTLLLTCASLPAQQRRRRNPPRRQRPAAATTQTNRATTRDASAAATPARPPASPRTSTQTTTTTRAAQNARPADAPEPADITFDTLLPEGTYAFYFEERAVGRQSREGGLFELLRPAFDFAPVPREAREFFEFFNAHSELLTDARLLIAFAPSEPSLPSVLTAVELPSAEAAEKFAPEYEKQLAALAPQEADEEAGAGRRPGVANVAVRVSEGYVPKMYTRRVGNLVVSSDKQFKLQTLRPRQSRPLSADPRFKAARSRFASEPLFAFVDIAAVNKVISHEMAEAEARRQQAEEEARRREAETAAANPAPPDEAATATDAGVGEQQPTPAEIEELQRVAASQRAAAVGLPATAEAGVGDDEELGPGAEGESAAPPGGETVVEGPDLFAMLAPLVFGGREQGFAESLPSALGAAVSPEGDTLALRVMLFNDEEKKDSLVPFLPSLLAGPALSPEGAGVARADTSALVTLSLDLPRMYERLLETAARFEQETAASVGEPPPPGVGQAPAGPGTPTLTMREEAGEAGPLARLRAIEKVFNFKIKEDLIDSLGNEITLSIPQQWFRAVSSVPPPPPADPAQAREDDTTAGQTTTAAAPPAASATPAPPVQRSFVVIIPLRDKAKLESILPRVASAFGMRRAPEAGAARKPGGAEVFNFGTASLAFVGNSLVASPDEESVRSVIAAHTDGQTLASAPDFRAATRWQPRQLIGQLYVAGNMTKGVFSETRAMVERETDPETRRFLPHLSGEPGPVTLAAAGEADGPLYELRVPTNMLAMFAALTAVEDRLAPVRNAESQAVVALQSAHHAQTLFKETKGRSFGTLEELVTSGLTYGGLFEIPGYKIEMTVGGDKYEVTATPTEYPTRGRRSFFIDETGVLRGGDKGGRPASAADEQITY